MPWRYERNTELGIVEVFYTGTTSAQDLQESTSALIELEKRENLNRFLVDVSAMTLDASTSLLDILALPARQYLEEHADRRGCVAVFVPDSSAAVDAVRFYETACRNRGWIVQRFAEHGEALAWLADD